MCPWRFAGELFEIVGAAIGGDWATARELINHSRRRGSGYGQDFGIEGEVAHEDGHEWNG
ncbi:MAG: hypothetical protein ACKOPT_03410 [Cyanobium sp.]